MKKVLAFLFALLATPAAAQTIPAGAWGSINYWGVGGLSQVLAPGLAGQCLTTQNVGSAPIWVNCQVSSLSLLPPISANSIMANNTLNFVAPQAIDVNRVLDMVGYDIIRPPVAESIIYKSNVGPNFNWQTLPPGTSGSLLTSGGPTNPPFWSPSTTQADLSSICQTVGAVLYFDTPSLLWKCLAPGTSGQLLQTGGGAANPSWLTVTLATLGGVPSTRNVNTSAPLGGGGALSADLTLTCATCATTTNGGALSATAPVVLSAAGNISMTNQGTTTTVLHGNAAGNPTFGSVAIGTDVSGLGTGVATALGVNVGTAGAPVVNGGALGTPSSGVATNLTGTAASLTAGNATNVGITDDTTTNATMFPTWVTANTGNLPAKTTSTKLTFNPSTGQLGTTTLGVGTTSLGGYGQKIVAGNGTQLALDNTGQQFTELDYYSNNVLKVTTFYDGSGAEFVFRTLAATNANIGFDTNGVRRLTINSTGQIRSPATTPSAGTCGTSPSVSGSDVVGQITTGSTATTACTLTFNATWTTAPFCVVTPFGAANTGLFVLSTGTGSMVINYTSATSAKFNYHCISN